MLHVVQCSCLEKILPNAPLPSSPFHSAPLLMNEELAYQIVIHNDKDRSEKVEISVDSALFYHVHLVDCVSVTWPHYANDTKEYICDSPQAVPDCLIPFSVDQPLWINKNYTVLWVTIRPPFPGDFTIEFTFKAEREEATCVFSTHVLSANIGEPYFTNDCYIDPIALSDYYQVPMFCDKHWEVIGKYMKLASENGITGIMAPVFTPEYEEYPSDGRILQLVDISCEGRNYNFLYDKLDCWVALAKKHGIKHFTVPPIFPTLEGPRHVKIYGTKDRHLIELFADEPYPFPHYMAFLRKFLRELIAHLKEKRWHMDFTFHFTTIPLFAHEKVYREFRPSMRDVLKWCPVQDYQVTYGFYMNDVVSDPIVTLHEMCDYMEHLDMGVTGCFDIISHKDVINQLIATPAVRLKALGLLAYKYDISGLFNLGFNYFSATTSGATANPFMNTDYGGRYPSGSLSLTYPGAQEPYPSVRLKLIQHAMQDVAILRKLEGQMSRNRLITLIDREFPISFKDCSLRVDRYWRLREKIFEFYEHHMKKMK